MTLIALDLDGTLEDSRADMVAAIHRVRAALGLPERPDADLEPFVSKGMDTLYLRCFDDFGVADDPGRYARVEAAYENDYLANVAITTRLYPGIRAALRDLSELGTLAVVTNKPERISRALLQALDIAPFFATVIGGDTCAESKPSPLMLATAAAKVGLTHDRAVMIGDSGGDVVMGRAYGAITIWCAWGYARAITEHPDHVARTPDELAGIVQDAISSVSTLSGLQARQAR
ncbi:MAG: HAD-IA family hydrolase [Myxococcales bacterium]|nr:HAD-IA family hydrolase [Myxococcales bacterium]MCB9546064.1 HAD-IA family hydrolase [Myxococcales bacterium]